MDVKNVQEKQIIFSEQPKAKLVLVCWFCVFGILLNMAGSYLSVLLNAPLYMDTYGTILVAAMGGYLPGILVGLVTNFCKGILDSTSIYYGVINIFVAACVTFLVNRNYLKKLRTFVAAVIVLSLISGSLSAVLSWFLYGFSIDDISVPFLVSLYERGVISPFMTQLCKDVIIDFADKSLMMVCAALLMRMIPERVRELFHFAGWQQRPLSDSVVLVVQNIKCRRISLKMRIILLLLLAFFLIGLVANLISFFLFRKSTTEEHEYLANAVAELAASTVDAERVDEFIEKGEAAEGYKETEERLYRIKESSPEIRYIYVYRILEDGCHVVFDLDVDGEMGDDPGDIVEFDQAFSHALPDLLAGREIEPVVSDESYGWLLTVYVPILDKSGKCQCYAAADVSMEQLVKSQERFFVRLLSLFLGFFILIMVIGLWLAKYNIILPINTMALSASAFAHNSEEVREQNMEKIRELDIHTGDEIENLYHAFLRMMEDNVEYVADIRKKTETITEMQNSLILVLADMVESRDQCTGDHVRKTAAYAKIIMEEMRKKGYYADQLTDEFMEDVVNSAPLHDIGKIHVPDAILNKPGKLTDEEFEIMKTHTTAGNEILSKVIATVPDSAGYLAEAKNLAAYHHEKWNGKGYPTGLAEEEIPLSARIMAVADVFDALVSKRSYKKAFPFDKAMGIIESDAGTHFDPKVADAFLSAKERVFQIAEEFEGASE